jgi:type I restriction enzyme S subunit
MSEWKECKLGDMVEIRHGYAFKGELFSDEETENILVTPGNFRIGGGFKTDKLKFYNGKVPEGYILQTGDLIVTMTDLSKNADTLGYSAIVPKIEGKRFLHNQRLGRVTCKSNSISMMFINWLLRTEEYRWHVIGSASGSTVSHTSPTRILDYQFSLPPLPEQRAIAGVLSSLDDKIDLLHRQNKTLEGMAEALWRNMFIEEADPGWKKGKLGDFGQIICGKTPSKKVAEYFGGHIPFIKIPDMHGNVFIFETEDSLTEAGGKSQQNKTIPARSICVSCIATVGLVGINAVDSQTNQQINTIIPNKEFQRYYLFLLLRNMTDDLIVRASGGTATDNLNTGDFSRIEISIPPENTLTIFDSLVKKFFEKLYINSIQIHTLSRLRDAILPKLMSGEARVKV